MGKEPAWVGVLEGETVRVGEGGVTIVVVALGVGSPGSGVWVGVTLGCEGKVCVGVAVGFGSVVCVEVEVGFLVFEGVGVENALADPGLVTLPLLPGFGLPWVQFPVGSNNSSPFVLPSRSESILAKAKDQAFPADKKSEPNVLS